MNLATRQQLPTNLYSAEAVRNLDAIAINEFNISAYELMKRAGKALFNHLQNRYPIAKHIVVVCGAGNNAGDGYVVAKLAMQSGLDVSVVSLIDPAKLQGDAKTAWKDWHSLSHQPVKFSQGLVDQADVVIDALLGTGLQRDLEGKWAETVQLINQSDTPVIAVDIPSGLCADTGRVAGCAIRATSTMSFIGLKKGQLTHLGVDHCGELLFDGLSIPEGVYKRQPPQAICLDWAKLRHQLKPRKHSMHKHQCGHVIVLGGDKGMPGAARMAAEAALRAGAGLVTIVSHEEHAAVMLSGRPEIMLSATDDGHVSSELLNKATAIVIGPGMADSIWSRNLLSAALQSHAPKLIDAGALRLLSEEDDGRRDDWVLTPHPGEAASLLGESTSVVQDSRFTSVELLQQKYGGYMVLKGAGSLLQSPISANEKLPQVCPYGNPGMASAGMGDVLSGVIGSFLAQDYGFELASQLGVCVHSLAGDLAAKDGQTGLLASDLFAHIRQLVNT